MQKAAGSSSKLFHINDTTNRSVFPREVSRTSFGILPVPAAAAARQGAEET